MNQWFGKFYAGSIGFITGTASYLNDVGIDHAFYGLLFRTMIVAMVSTLTGLVVRHFYLNILHKINKLRKKI